MPVEVFRSWPNDFIYIQLSKTLWATLLFWRRGKFTAEAERRRLDTNWRVLLEHVRSEKIRQLTKYYPRYG